MIINVIGAGLAGCEAAYYLAQNGIKVNLYEMKPTKRSEVHKTKLFSELVCSNSLRSDDPFNAAGMIKEEMRKIGSLILEAANVTKVPAGSSLAVDRLEFSAYITDRIKTHPLITVINEEVTQINKDEYTIIAAGPMASEGLFEFLKKELKQDTLHFFDAVAPIISKDSINMDIAYIKNRYDKGEATYINCGMSKEEYLNFYNELVNATTIIPKEHEIKVFEGCMPVETMAKRGVDTLLFGPLKPVGLDNGETRYHAVVQLRQDDASKTMYNMVGFQTQLTFGEQKRIINMIPGLENANILRYGVMHRNTYLESPKLLNSSFQVIDNPKWFFAGQISGVEGYIESAASGLNVAIQLVSLLKDNKLRPLPVETMMGAMARYISTKNSSFVPMNANLGLLDELGYKHKKKERKELYYKRSMAKLEEYLNG